MIRWQNQIILRHELGQGSSLQAPSSNCNPGKTNWKPRHSQQDPGLKSVTVGGEE